MSDLPDLVMGWAWPAVAVLFIGLYVINLAAGVEVEVALVRAGAAGVALAVVLRAGVWLMESMERPSIPEHTNGHRVREGQTDTPATNGDAATTIASGRDS